MSLRSAIGLITDAAVMSPAAKAKAKEVILVTDFAGGGRG
jgi:hypothetical protein